MLFRVLLLRRTYFSGMKLRWMLDNVPAVAEGAANGTALLPAPRVRPRMHTHQDRTYMLGSVQVLNRSLPCLDLDQALKSPLAGFCLDLTCRDLF